MTISAALQTALSGLKANGRLAEVTSNNLANALTPGYGRQSVVLGSSVTAGQGTGVEVRGLERAQDPELTAARRLADGNLAEESARFDGLARLEAAFGTVEDPASLANRAAGFERALRSLAETPESAAAQSAAVDAGRDLAEKFNQISTETAKIRQSADGEITRQVERVNTALKRITQINRQIQIFEASGRETAALVDERERLIDEVAQNIPIRETRRGDGVVELRTASGLPLADTVAREFAFTATPTITADLSVGAGTLGRLTLDGRDVTPGAGGPQRIEGGALGGLFELRDRIAPEAQARADALAADLIARTPDPDGLPGDPGLFTDLGAAFDPMTDDATGLAGRIQLNANVDPQQLSTVDPGNPGAPWRMRDGLSALAPALDVADDTIPRAFLDGLTASQASAVAAPGLEGALSFAGRTAQSADLLATARVSAEVQVSALAGTRETLATEESGVLGVDSDVELSRLVQIEQAYAANAQVIQTATRMLDELSRIGR